MKYIRKMIALFMVVLLFTAVFGVSAMAAKKVSGKGVKNTGIETMASGKWYVGKYNQLSRFKLSKDSIVTFKWKSNSKDKPMGIAIYADKEMEYHLLNLPQGGQDGTTNGTKSFAIAKGTYYLRIQGSNWGQSDYDGKALGKVMIKASKLNDKKNYCPSRAVALKKNTKCTYGTTPMNSYLRFWYKIVTTKKQKITVITSDEYNSCELFYPNLNGVYMESYGSQTRKTKEALPAGTYYLAVAAPHYNNVYFSETSTFSWK